MTPCKFTFDDGPEFDGFAYGSTWNGFDNVAVNHVERAKIAEWMIKSALDKDAVAEEVHDLMLIEPVEGIDLRLYSLGWGYATRIVREPLPLPGNAADIIAARFVTVLRAWLDPQEWAQMQQRNAAERDPLICHSHDYCDANMAMAEAFESVTGTLPDGEDNDTTKLWNAAWALAAPALGSKNK